MQGVKHSKISAIADASSRPCVCATGVKHSKISAIADEDEPRLERHQRCKT